MSRSAVDILDQNAWGLAVATDKPPKPKEIVDLDGNSYVALFMSASDGGVWYVRYVLRKLSQAA